MSHKYEKLTVGYIVFFAKIHPIYRLVIRFKKSSDFYEIYHYFHPLTNSIGLKKLGIARIPGE